MLISRVGSALCSPTVGRRGCVQDEQSTLISGRVSAAYVEALTAEAEGGPKQVLTTFMAHVAERQV